MVIDGRLDANDGGGMGFAIDTLAYARRLREAGFSEQQANEVACDLADSHKPKRSQRP